LKAIWEKLKESYTVTFDSDGGTAINAQIVDKDGKVTKPADPIKDGYNFVQWNNGISSYDFSAVVTADITLKAIWEKVEIYTVTFDTDGGTTISAQTVEKGGKANKPVDPTKYGFIFQGWSNGSAPYDFTSAVTADLTLKAVWEEIITPNPGGNITALPGAFTVSADGKQVQFASGNLQYKPSTKTWRFAPTQTDTIGFFNWNIADVTYDGWIDLFGWGTGDSPNRFSMDNSDYTTFSEWGKNIGDGAWYTLSIDEWSYIFFTRNNASKKRSFASVNGVKGYILLPDAFTFPAGLNFNYMTLTFNEYTADQWSKMEDAGAVFLPAAGFRSGSSVGLVGTHGYYWSSTPYNDRFAFKIYFETNSYTYSTDGAFEYYDGFSVRLVRAL
ncbi:MAG: InlB B-repeat-containing protein, partial [Bacteroidales bacterium]|nr:InlB B-repeat-containing protein [Bacteroidales bacterium]